MIKDFELTDILNGKNQKFREISSPEEVKSFASHIEENYYHRSHKFHMMHGKGDPRRCSYVNYNGLREVCFPSTRKINKEPLEYHLIGDEIEICLRNIITQDGAKGINGYINLTFATEEEEFNQYIQEIEKFWPKIMHK